MLEYEFSLTHVFPHWNRVFGFNPYMRKYHCVKNVPIWSFSGHYFPTFGPEKPRKDQKNLLCKSIINGLQSMYWFLYERDLRHERVNLGIDLIRFLI